MTRQLWLVRHGETEWARIGRHTGLHDLPLTETGREQALALPALLNGREFAKVMVSPLARARQTAELAGYGGRAEVDAEMHEWNYGDYEGRTSAEIAGTIPNWNIWVHGVEGGESVAQVAARAERVLERALAAGGDVLLFAHGHFLRILTARWLNLDPSDGRLFAMLPAAVSVLGYEGPMRVIRSWNRQPG